MVNFISDASLNRFYLADTIFEDVCSSVIFLVVLYTGFKIKSNYTPFVLKVYLFFFLSAFIYVIYELSYSYTND